MALARARSTNQAMCYFQRLGVFSSNIIKAFFRLWLGCLFAAGALSLGSWTLPHICRRLKLELGFVRTGASPRQDVVEKALCEEELQAEVLSEAGTVEPVHISSSTNFPSFTYQSSDQEKAIQAAEASSLMRASIAMRVVWFTLPLQSCFLSLLVAATCAARTAPSRVTFSVRPC